MSHSKKYLTSRQVRDRYQISDMTLWRWLKDPLLNFPRPDYINGRRFFDTEKQDRWDEERSQGNAA